jgi:hypothetical protein
MARVGSQSVYQSLRSQGISYAYHLHVISAKQLYLIYPKTMRTARMRSVFLDLRREAQTLGPLLLGHIATHRREVRIITPVRDPIARNVSLFFHLLWVAGFSFERHSIDELTGFFMDDMRHQIALTWFERELEPALGIDMYAFPFHRDAGHTTIIANNITLLLYQSELPDHVKEHIIGDFVGLEQFRLLRRHDARGSAYAKTYRQFVQLVHLPRSYVEEMCNSRYARHFYSDDERERIRAKWLHL